MILVILSRLLVFCLSAWVNKKAHDSIAKDCMQQTRKRINKFECFIQFQIIPSLGTNSMFLIGALWLNLIKFFGTFSCDWFFFFFFFAFFSFVYSLLLFMQWTQHQKGERYLFCFFECNGTYMICFLCIPNCNSKRFFFPYFCYCVVIVVVVVAVVIISLCKGHRH